MSLERPDVDRAVESMAEALRVDDHAPWVEVQEYGVTKLIHLSDGQDEEPFFTFTIVY